MLRRVEGLDSGVRRNDACGFGRAEPTNSVIPAKAGIQFYPLRFAPLESGLRRNDE
jgi:hypothetical protein